MNVNVQFEINILLWILEVLRDLKEILRLAILWVGCGNFAFYRITLLFLRISIQTSF